MPSNYLAPVWIIATQDYADIACETCARQWAEGRRIPRSGDLSYQLSSEGADVTEEAYEIFPYYEGDTPASCQCGQYLATQLTSEGQDYLAQGDFPQWVREAYAQR